MSTQSIDDLIETTAQELAVLLRDESTTEAQVEASALAAAEAAKAHGLVDVISYVNFGVSVVARANELVREGEAA